MKKFQLFFIAIGCLLATNVMAQEELTPEQQKAQKAVIDQLRKRNITPTIDASDNSVCFRHEDVFYWITFDSKKAHRFTLHRKGLNFDEDPTFISSCALEAANAVNQKHRVKCVLNNRRVEFILQTIASEPSHFNEVLMASISAFGDVDETFISTYNAAFDKWKEDSIQAAKPITSDGEAATSPLKITYFAFANYTAKGKMISDYNQPLRKSEMKYLKTTIDVSSKDKGLYKIGIKITNPENKVMLATKGAEYSSVTNIEIKKASKVHECDLTPYGSNEEGFWKAGEYNVVFYDAETGAKLHATTFTIL